ncbi:hypothetical protein C8N35_1166 [Breoghania corrubedonensis]|uniref:Uncharacterized protein n=1 Tax=Breoghania corrubedonensis TaxID=665038 RepID=A0A2T5UQ59_9HYPH|nr:hypothetical protein [Breoghania corrubedonensis]PTW53551.1 hypothetical protein C8N35_1166 [Breoghania corrubedonensis]
MSDEYFIADLRASFRRNPFITFWRPNNEGYTYPLVWAGRYSAEDVRSGGEYYTKCEGNTLARCAVPCDAVFWIAGEPARGLVDGDVGPVMPNTPNFRGYLRVSACRKPGEMLGGGGLHGPAAELLVDAIRSARRRTQEDLASYPLLHAVMDAFETSPWHARWLCEAAQIDPKTVITRLHARANDGGRS